MFMLTLAYDCPSSTTLLTSVFPDTYILLGYFQLAVRSQSLPPGKGDFLPITWMGMGLWPVPGSVSERSGFSATLF